MVMKSGIYRITCLSNGKCYIGSSCDIRRRKLEHVNALKRGKHYNAYLQKAWDKYGESSFVFSIIEYCSVPDLIPKEQSYFNSMGNNKRACFNLSFIAGRVEITPEVRRKMSVSQGGNKNSLGYRHSLETRRKMSESRKGNCNATTKLTKSDILEIRKDFRLQKEIALEYGVQQGTISRIKNNKRRQSI